MRTNERQRGATAAEFALCAVIFFGAVFFLIELARALYLLNTLQEATRRAAALAAVSDFSDPAAMDRVRQAAVLRDGPGALPLGAPVTDAHIRIDYLSLARTASGVMTMTPIPAASLPACPARARIQCVANPNGDSCIRFVRVRLCAPGAGDCQAVPYQPLLPLTAIKLPLPQVAATAKAESLGFQPGSALCP
ncbi:pilus assembly protein [Pseudoduganella sp. FT25W]|uniref:Pilus assembly protein n=1 Tax=Duganella alba TaxID=2666081 RepID=A0A6L5QCT5_9BURK|nr:TadE/TadG family type IV pilus assembly protein [Duganella alba]MRX07439.1 pilus assembly protein [Duganella alba]MRX15824.1 pilus assembly protein [Duganella alba]